MPILNYTTTISVEKTVGEIIGKLATHGATRISIDYAERQPIGIAFTIETTFGPQAFRLPAQTAALQRILRLDPKVQMRYTSTEHAAKVAWRIVKDWLEAQLALIEAGQASLDQVMLPYLVTEDGRTVYQLFSEKRLALPPPREERA